MRNVRVALALALALALWLATGAFGQPGTDEETNLESVSAELHRIGSTLEEIRVLLAKQVETRTLELMLKRTDLTSREVADLERELRDTRGTLQSTQHQAARMKDSFETMAASQDLSDAEAENFETQMENELERFEASTKRLEREISLLEGRLAGKRRELEEWRATVDQRLEDRQP